MRVIAGDAKGHPLQAPKGLDTRPTSDKVRGAIFSMLASMGMEAPERVLDLYAGTGALAIEALSRGAEHADLVEASPAACGAIRANLQRTRLAERAQVVQARVERALGRLEGPYDLVFLDPPYAATSVMAVLEELVARGLVDANAVVVYEHSRRTTPPATVGSLRLFQTRCHGDTCVTIYDRE